MSHSHIAAGLHAGRVNALDALAELLHEVVDPAVGAESVGAHEGEACLGALACEIFAADDALFLFVEFGGGKLGVWQPLVDPLVEFNA